MLYSKSSPKGRLESVVAHFHMVHHPKLAGWEQLSMCSELKRIAQNAKTPGIISTTGVNFLSVQVYPVRRACVFVCGLVFADAAAVFIPKQKQAADPPEYG